MNTPIVLTVIANDQPGIIETVSGVLNSHGGNWTQSSMSSLAGQFAGILLASVPAGVTGVCIDELRGLEERGLRIIVQTCEGHETGTGAGESQSFSMELVGNDRPGIVADVTRVLANHHVSVNTFETAIESASMAGGDLFRARANLLLPPGSDIEALESELEGFANDLMVDIRLER